MALHTHGKKTESKKLPGATRKTAKAQPKPKATPKRRAK